MNPAELDPVRRWLLASTGLQADRLGRERLERVVAQRLCERGCGGPGVYHQLLLADPGEQQELVERLVVGESWFLREPRSFAQLLERARGPRQGPLRVLSCGCAGGEEPYSVVIALLEAGLAPGQLQVEAIDISAVALERAAQGLYGAHALRGMDPARLARFFLPEGPRWRLRPEIRGLVRFHQGPLRARLAGLPGGWQVVLCRNVMLYLEEEARRELLMAIAERLAPDGLLLVAAAEAAMVPSGGYQRLEGGHGAGFRPLPVPVVASSGPPAVLPPPAVAVPPVVPAALQPAAHLAAARRLRQGGALEEALQAVRRCLYLDPDHLEALALMAALARDLGRAEEAERQLGRLRRRQGRQP